VNRVDQEALRRALKLARAEPDYREQLEHKVKTEGWESAAVFASYCLQIDSLNLKCWQDPPCFAEVRPDPEALAILLKLIGHGLSRYEPYPAQVLAAVRSGPPAAAT
jgi:hypothetical protein